jgi:hypothetical protein
MIAIVAAIVVAVVLAFIILVVPIGMPVALAMIAIVIVIVISESLWPQAQHYRHAQKIQPVIPRHKFSPCSM